MSVVIDLNGVPVQFPFKPYDIQKEYMSKVIECIQNETVAVLESPTGTGKTLSLLCASLAWLQLKKAQLQAQNQKSIISQDPEKYDAFSNIAQELEEKAGQMTSGRSFLGLPTIIYASRTHSQLSQAMQELKRTAYSYMKASVLGSRDQLCIHPEVLAEQERGLRLHICRVKLMTRSCHFNNRVEKKKEDPEICERSIIDIEDMVKLGEKHKFCPYYMTKEMQQKADIIFAPYNYLLDPVARKALGLNLGNAVIILDEAHNVEKVCEESASIDIKSTDIALAIDELTAIMKMLVEMPAVFEEGPKDLDPEECAVLKEMLLNFEKVMDEVPLKTSDEVTNYPGDYIFEMLDQAQINAGNFLGITSVIEKIVQFLTTKNNGPFARNGKGLQLFSDFLAVVFAGKGSKEKIKSCYKVHIKEEDKNVRGKKQVSTWLDKGSKNKCRVLSFWCFSPGFGMDLIMNQNIKALILTSGTLAPLKPLISELELNVTIQLENPHIVTANQICVKILPKGPDGEPLNSSYNNRDNPRYVSSLGRAIVNLSRIIPSGLLIFFPSYPIMEKCQNQWQEEGIWGNIGAQKAIFVEPRGKDAFNAAMTGYYEKIRDPNLKGAVFMAVCRGKVSEGLDFADANGRAVIITGLPYPPLRDPRVILKRRYLDQCHAKDKEFLTGGDWYGLEATRAVNQAIGRVIRHRYDYGAILLLDQRFDSFRIKEQMSKWLRNHIKVVNKYGDVIRDLSQFYRRAQSELPTPELKPLRPLNPPAASFDSPVTYKKGNFDFSTSSLSVPHSSADNSVMSSDSSTSNNETFGMSTTEGLVTIHKTKRNILDEPLVSNSKRKKIILVPANTFRNSEHKFDLKASQSEYVAMVKTKLGPKFKDFILAIGKYQANKDIQGFLEAVEPLVPLESRYIFLGLSGYIKDSDKSVYSGFLRRNNLAMPEDL